MPISRAGKLKLLYVAPERLSGESFLDRLRRVKHLAAGDR